MQMDFHDLLVAISVLVGFQVTLFIWRIDREVEKKPEQQSWLPPSDCLGGLSMLCFVVGGLLLPIVGAIDIQVAKKLFGLGVLLTMGHLFGLVGTMNFLRSKFEPMCGFHVKSEAQRRRLSARAAAAWSDRAPWP